MNLKKFVTVLIVSCGLMKLSLLDSHSTDGTTEIAKELGAKVIQINFNGFGRFKK